MMMLLLLLVLLLLHDADTSGVVADDAFVNYDVVVCVAAAVQDDDVGYVVDNIFHDKDDDNVDIYCWKQQNNFFVT